MAGYCLVVINSAGPWVLAHDAFHGSLCLFSTVPRFVPNFIAPAIINFIPFYPFYTCIHPLFAFQSFLYIFFH